MKLSALQWRRYKSRKAIPETVAFSLELASLRHTRKTSWVCINYHMKKLLTALLVGSVVVACYSFRGAAQDKAARTAAKYEYAVVKWDGPDRLFYNLPSKFELVHIENEGVKIPRDAQNEEFCLAYAANKMAADGWEPVNLDSRRIVFRREK